MSAYGGTVPQKLLISKRLCRRVAFSVGSHLLITGKRGLIDDHSNDILRAAGIYHIVSISGLHMVLAAGVFFWITRALLALSPTLALGWPIKKIAAVAGMAGAFAYDVFSGSDVATERSLIMILVMQAAILFDRPALSLRNLALSALIVLTREPETLLGPSLQMSYAAVAGLIAFAEWERRRRRVAEAGDPLKRAACGLGASRSASWRRRWWRRSRPGRSAPTISRTCSPTGSSATRRRCRSSPSW